MASFKSSAIFSWDFLASSRSRMAFSSSRTDISSTGTSSMNSFRSGSGRARSASALEAPKSANVVGFVHSLASFINRFADRSENSTFSDSQVSHSPWESRDLASISLAPISKSASPAVFFKSRISSVIVSISRAPLTAGAARPIRSSLSAIRL